MSTEQLTVVMPLPAMPLVLADEVFMATLASVEKQIEVMKVETLTEAQEAANLQVRLTTAGKKLNAARIALNKSLADGIAKINDAARGPDGRIEAAKDRLKLLIGAFDAEQRRIAAEAEQKRRDELTRLENQRMAEQAALDKKAAELAAVAAEAAKKSAPIFEMDFDEGPPPKTETQKAIEAIQHAPAVVAPKVAGLAFKVRLVANVVDATLLPEMFVERVAKLLAIQQTFCTGWKEGAPLPICPGVKFEVKREAVSTGRFR